MCGVSRVGISTQLELRDGLGEQVINAGRGPIRRASTYFPTCSEESVKVLKLVKH